MGKIQNPIGQSTPASTITVDQQQEPKKIRQIIIETDGDSIHLVKADVSGKLELMAILQGLLGYLNQKQ